MNLMKMEYMVFGCKKNGSKLQYIYMFRKLPFDLEKWLPFPPTGLD